MFIVARALRPFFLFLQQLLFAFAPRQRRIGSPDSVHCLNLRKKVKKSRVILQESTKGFLFPFCLHQRWFFFLSVTSLCLTFLCHAAMVCRDSVIVGKCFGVENGYAFPLCFDELGEEPCSTVCSPPAGTLAPSRVSFSFWKIFLLFVFAFTQRWYAVSIQFSLVRLYFPWFDCLVFPHFR